MAYENKLDEIETTAMELRRNIGTTAANDTARPLPRSSDNQQCATVLQRMDVEDGSGLNLKLTRKQPQLEIQPMPSVSCLGLQELCGSGEKDYKGLVAFMSAF